MQPAETEQYSAIQAPEYQLPPVEQPSTSYSDLSSPTEVGVLPYVNIHRNINKLEKTVTLTAVTK